ncbi:outer membrane protein assembly factor BamB family protein [Nocardia albiluteola]|uniref:outer membrane protein assembly factor BamB family protein n=1 Tax=Nocardia albiluteola TaxID=2842303 RepID=UPI0027E0F65A|nr:PQQ-binding-like beta-propeller repeat protein [Nocardia albiluteola]
MRTSIRRPAHDLRNTQASPRSAVRRPAIRAAAALGVVGVLTLSGCGGTTLDNITVGPGKGWPTTYHDARNSAASPVTGSRHLTLNWTRPIGGPAATATTVGPDGQMFVTTDLDTDCIAPTPAGGALFSFQMPTGRKRFCDPMGPSAIYSASAIDGATNVYVGDDGSMNSINALGQPRWRTPVAGVPISVQFTGDSHVLTVTQSGQIDVLNRQTGDRMAATFQLLGWPDPLAHPDLPRPADGQGLQDCATGGPQCAVANVSAIDPSGNFYATAWRPGSPVASLVALRYADKQIRQLWSADMLTNGSATSPALSSDGKTVYVGDNSGRLLAVDASNGHTKWVQPLGFSPQGAISEQDGLLIPGGNGGHLMALRDKGTGAEIAWERKDLQLSGQPVQTAGGTGYTVSPIGGALHLVTFDTTTGSTIASAVLPGAQGTTTGTSVGAKGQVVITTRVGEIYVFKPDK